MDIYFTSKFLRTLKKLPDNLQQDVIIATELFKDTKNHKQLSLHKLKGDKKKYHSFSVNYEYRVVIKFEGSKKVYFMNVGTHEVYN